MTMAPRRRGRPRTGHVYRHGDHFDIRIRLADKRGRPVHLDPRVSETEARSLAAQASALAIAEGATRDPTPDSSETADAWLERWTADRVARGIATAGQTPGRWHKWIAPVIGHLPIARIEREDVERVVDRLDEAVRAGAIRAQTASHTWVIVKAAFRDAQRAKTRTLRVRSDNPTEGVQGPDQGPDRSKPWLYPCEFSRLMACPRVPMRWRRLFALATYLYLRAGELAALTIEDVDLVGGVVLVHQTTRYGRRAAATTATGPTKTKISRRIPIERALRPLLGVLIAEARAEGRARIVCMPSRRELAAQLRRYLEWAGVNRAALFADDETRAPLTFHDLRATGLTWRAIRGDDALKVQRAAGHASLETTQRYIREAEVIGHEIGLPFPDLPQGDFSTSE
ncbi:MAG: tyrosine-type recombinase/integrase [Polyangiaceae bacterium]